MTIARWALAASLLAAAPALAMAAPARPAITGISHIAVYTTDAAAADTFYVHDLGGVKRDDPENPKGVRYYFNPVQFVEVLPLPAGYASISRLDHLAWRTADAEGLREYMKSKGIKVPARVKHGSDGSKWFDVKDPEDNTIEFVEPPANPAAVPDNPLSNHIIHAGYLVHSRAAEDTFYRDVLGFRPYWYGNAPTSKVKPAWISQQVPDGTDWLEYMTVAGPEKTGVPPGMSKHDVGVLNHFSLGVKNMEDAVTMIWDDRLAPVNDGGPKIGLDGKWQFNEYDPDGTRVEFMEFHARAKPCCSPFTAADPEK